MKEINSYQRQYNTKNSFQTEIDMNKGEDDSKAQKKRIKSLDTFRG